MSVQKLPVTLTYITKKKKKEKKGKKTGPLYLYTPKNTVNYSHILFLLEATLPFNKIFLFFYYSLVLCVQ